MGIGKQLLPQTGVQLYQRGVRFDLEIDYRRLTNKGADALNEYLERFYLGSNSFQQRNGSLQSYYHKCAM
jgi:hypothetical protein